MNHRAPLVIVAATLTMSAGCAAARSAGRGASSRASSSSSPAALREGDGALAGVLTAGTWRDLDDWARFRGVFDDGPFAGLDAHWGVVLAHRVPVVAVDADGGPVVDAAVRAFDAKGNPVARARTDNHGRAELFPDDNGPVRVEVDGCDPRDTDGFVEIKCAAEQTPPPALLDLMLVVDTTGSMGDELTFLQRELEDVVNRVARDQRVEVRVGVDVYRDEGDAYLVRTAPFADAKRAVGFLRAQSADGGGDYPEALDEALVDAVRRQPWSERARSRVALLVLDAPPHDDQASVVRVKAAMQAAAERGIRLIPVAASGVDQATEALLRSLAAGTGGTYVFLTDDSGIGDAHLAPTVGEYTVESLNDLLVRIIGDTVRIDGRSVQT